MKYTATKTQGLTLVEMLVVMVVLAILVSLVVGISSYVTGRANREATVMTQSVLMMAIEEYRDITGSPPSVAYDEDDPPIHRSKILFELLTDEATNPQLKKVVEIVRRLPAKAIAEDTEDSNRRYFADGWGRPMDYRTNQGIGGVPVLISAGPDGDHDEKADNVRSDGRARK